MSQEIVHPHIQILLQRPVGTQIHFNDVIPESSPDERYWWQTADFDASLTIKAESAGFSGIEFVPIGRRPWHATYGLVVVDDLHRALNDRVARINQLDEPRMHPDQLRERHRQSQALVALANQAHRDNANTSDGQNGSDFHLAITDAGLEIYTTPLHFLGGLEARNRIIALYRIPTAGHPEFNGAHEQFRSARIIRTRRHPGHLVPVFQYATKAGLLKAKANGTHPRVIATDQRSGHFAHVDTFGNVRGELNDINSLTQLAVGSEANLLIKNNNQTHSIPVVVAEDLRSAPLNKLAVYTNVSDYLDPMSKVGLFEIITRVDENPNTSKNTAIFTLLAAVPGLDLERAEISLQA